MQEPSQKSSAFEGLYAGVPAEQVARLREFRLSHPYKHLAACGERWEYISCGQGEETLLLLPGALSIAESTFPLITAFEDEYRVVSPTYALSQSMSALCQGIASILEAENVRQAHVFGGSYGGLVAQHFVRQYPTMTRSLILSHTFVLTGGYAKPLWIAGKLFPALPQSLFVPLLRLRLDRMLLKTLRAAKHPETEFWRAYLDEALASGLLKKVFIHQNNCLLELARQPGFTPQDLNGWRGKILIIESDDDPAVPARARALVRKTYPQARVHTFSGAGHASSILKRDEVVSVIKSFLHDAAQDV